MGTDNTTCEESAPCRLVATALATGRPYIKFRGTLDEAVTVEGGRVVTFLGEPGATLTRSSSGGPVLTVKGDRTSLAIYDLTIANAHDKATIGISIPPSSGAPILSLTHVTISNNPGGGIVVSGGMLTLTQSIVASNHGGGVVVNGTAKFVIVGNLFYGNNSAGDFPSGAIWISTSPAAINRLEFNTFYKNASQDGVGAAIHCVTAGFTAGSNIMFLNGTLTNYEQVGGSCRHVYSIAFPGTLPPGVGNQAADPRLQNPAKLDFHVQRDSPAFRAADPEADLGGPGARDLDGNVRARPATAGAYEVP